MNRALVYIVFITVILAIAVGALVFGRVERFSAAQQERARIENADLAERLEKEQGAKVLWAYAEKVIIALAILALLSVFWVFGMRRAAEIRPDAAGIFPVVRVRVAGVTALHNPNRAVTPITLYAPAQLANQVAVISVASGDPDAQERTTARAQAVQLAAASTRHAPAKSDFGGRGPDTPLVQPGDQERAYPWPARAPLTGLLNGHGASLHRLIMGVTVNQETGANELVTGDLAQLVHIAVGGSSGYGKSMFLRALAFQLATAPERPSLALVDLEAVTFAPFGQCDRLLYPIADTEQDALAVFRALTGELDRRKALFSEYPGVDSLDAYNTRATGRLERLPAVVTMVDEATALLADKGVESALRTLALRGRKYGLWLTLGGQDWKASSLDTAIRNQLSARVHFKAMSASQSRVLLGTGDAYDLPDDTPGRALAILPGRGTVKIQAPAIGYGDIVATLTGGGPRCDMPTGPVDVDQDADEGPTPEQVQEIHDLRAQGESLSEIARQVFGVAGGAAFYKVKDVLSE